MYDIISLNHKCGIALQGKSSPRHKTPTMMDKRNEKIRPPPPLDRASFALFTESWIDKRNKFTPH